MLCSATSEEKIAKVLLSNAQTSPMTAWLDSQACRQAVEDNVMHSDIIASGGAIEIYSRTGQPKAQPGATWNGSL